VTGRTDSRFLGPQDREWPEVLRRPTERNAASLGLWVRGSGDLGGLLRRAVVVLGAAAATPYAVTITHRLAAELTEAGWTVVTSGAAGVASAVRHGAFSAEGPAVVLPLGGIAEPKPRCYARQYERVTWAGLLVSENCGPPGDTDADREVRNGMFAVLGAAVVLVEPGGIASSVARQARHRGSPVFAVPGPATENSGSACAHQLLRDGTARLVRGAHDVLTDLRDLR
jgi:DNA processing protein